MLAVAGSIGVAGAAFLPWGRSGAARRSSFELVRAAERLELLEGSLAGAVAAAWFLVPMAAAAVWLAGVLHRRAVTGTLAVLVAALGLALAAVVRASPVRAQAGLGLGVLAACTALAGVVLMGVERRSGR